MSAETKKFLIRDYTERLDGLNDALVISIRGVNAIDNNKMRLGLAQKQIKVTVVRNNLARQAFKDSPLSGVSPLLDGPSALAYSVSEAGSVIDVAREIVKWAEQIQQLELKGAILDGQLFHGKAGVEQLSKFPTRDEAIAKAVTLILSPARTLMGQIKGPGSKVASIIKSIEEKLEKGEAISKTA